MGLIEVCDPLVIEGHVLPKFVPIRYNNYNNEETVIYQQILLSDVHFNVANVYCYV